MSATDMFVWLTTVVLIGFVLGRACYEFGQKRGGNEERLRLRAAVSDACGVKLAQRVFGETEDAPVVGKQPLIIVGPVEESGAFVTFNLSDGGRVHIPRDTIACLWNEEQRKRSPL